MKLNLTKGRFQRTDKNGNDIYSADYYNINEVKEYIKYCKKLESALKEMVSITKIHSNATSNNFAWAELEEAEKLLK
jgi:hypothetical protein